MANGSIRVPEKHLKVVEFISGLDDAGVKQWFGALAVLPPESLLSPEKWRQVLRRDEGWLGQQEDADGVVAVLSAMVSAISTSGRKTTDFVADLAKSLEIGGFWDSEEQRKIEPEALGRARQNLIKLLQVPSLVAAVKVSSVFADNDRSLFMSKINTELRPVFSEDAEGILAMTTCHRLRLTYLEEGTPDPLEFFVSLDAKDMLQLIEQAEHALKAQRVLQAFVNETNAPYIDMDEE